MKRYGINQRSTVNEHLKNIFKTGELAEDSAIRKIRITADDGKNYLTNFYNLDAIIAVGYRVNSYQAIQFRTTDGHHIVMSRYTQPEKDVLLLSVSA